MFNYKTASLFSLDTRSRCTIKKYICDNTKLIFGSSL